MPVSTVTSLLETIEKVEGLRELYGLGEWDDGWSRCSVSGEATAGLFDVSTLQELAAAGCQVELSLEVDRLRIKAIAMDSRAFAIEASGVWADVAEDGQAETTAANAVARNDLATMLSALSAAHFSLKITVFGKQLGHAWVRESDGFIREYERIGWFQFAGLIAPPSSRWNRILILDARDDFITAGEVVIVGPDAAWPEPSKSIEVRSDYGPGDCRSSTPTPNSLFPIDSSGSNLTEIKSILSTIAGNLVCVWLADSVSIDDSSVTVRMQGNRPIQGLVVECPREFAATSVKLWNWASEVTQPGRRHAVLQAITLQISDLKDIYSRSGSILDTAQFLFSIAQSGLIQEALAARGAARDAALQAANSAGSRARASARSAVDRVLVVVGAAIGIVLANEDGLIDRFVAFGLLGLAAALTIGALLMAFLVDLPGAQSSVLMFMDDLEERTEILLPSDIENIKQLPSLRKGLEDVARARRACLAIMAVALLSLVVATIVVGVSDTAHRNGSPTTTTATAHLLDDNIAV